LYVSINSFSSVIFKHIIAIEQRDSSAPSYGQMFYLLAW
jgi:hypothetical protein